MEIKMEITIMGIITGIVTEFKIRDKVMVITVEIAILEIKMETLTVIII